jgi:hypothetical protein
VQDRGTGHEHMFAYAAPGRKRVAPGSYPRMR